MTDPLNEHVDDLVRRGQMPADHAEGIKKAMPEFVFTTGGDANMTGQCQECKNGRHTECKSLRDNDDIPYPHFADDDSDRDRLSSWYCPCLERAEERKDYTQHGGAFLE